TVVNYRVTERPPVEPFSTIFLAPRGSAPAGFQWGDAALACLPLKRASDAWTLIRYQLSHVDGPAEKTDEDADALHFLINPDTIETEFQRTRGQTDETDSWRSIWRGV